MNVATCLGLLMVLLSPPALAADAPRAPRHLLVDVRDSPPAAVARTGRGADGSYTVSTGGADTDAGAGNASTLSTQTSIRRVRVTEGERIRVDLPAVQSLQFHVPLAAGPAGGAAAGPAPGSGTGPASANGAASGVVYFDGVGAFAARFFLRGDMVRVELTPLQRGSVSAPFVPAVSGPAGTVLASAPVGEWLPLGDSDLSAPGATLNPNPDPPSPAAVWVRVFPDPDDAP